jgi:hypothetical protein
MFGVVCEVVVDLKSLAPTLVPRTGQDGQQYYRFDFTIELLFGLTEHKAQVCWKENVRHFPMHMRLLVIDHPCYRAGRNGAYENLYVCFLAHI